MAVKLGKDAKAYRLTTGTRATWNATVDTNGYHTGPAPASAFSEMPKIRNVKYDISAGEADVTTRGNNGWKATAATLKDLSVDFDMVYDPADADVIAVMGAVNTGVSVPMAFLDGLKDVVGNLGIWADFQIFKTSKDEDLQNAQMLSFTAKPALTAVAPEFVKVTA
jgi:hypothetical protein